MKVFLIFNKKWFFVAVFYHKFFKKLAIFRIFWDIFFNIIKTHQKVASFPQLINIFTLFIRFFSLFWCLKQHFFLKMRLSAPYSTFLDDFVALFINFPAKNTQKISQKLRILTFQGFLKYFYCFFLLYFA